MVNFSGVYGFDFPHGPTGMISPGDGTFLFSEPFREGGAFGTDIRRYKADDKAGFVPAE